MTTIQPGRMSPEDLSKAISVDLYREAYRAGRNLSVHLERLSPSEGYNDGLDAFERLLKIHGIRTRSMSEIGVYADEMRSFERSDETWMLLPELYARMARRAATGTEQSVRALYTSSDDIPGSLAQPHAYAAAPRVQQQAAPIRLAELVAITTPIDAQSYDAYYLATSTTESTLVRVPEGTNIPAAKLTGGEKTIKLKKYGRGLESTYEALRRIRIDKVQLWMNQLAIQTEIDKVSAAIKVLAEGDGNTVNGVSTAATNYQAKTDFDATATAYNITLKAWLAYKLKFSPAYRLTHIIGAEGDILKLQLLNTGTANIPLSVIQAGAGFGTLVPMGGALSDDVRYGITANVPANKYVGLDARWALEQIVEIGSNIEEVERHARKQTQAIYITEVMGFAINDLYATRTLELEA